MKAHIFSKTLLATLLVAVAGQAMAVGDNADIKVSGQIAPSACIPTVGGGAVFDYGAIKAASLPQDEYTVLNEKRLSLDIVCNAPMKVAFKVYDARADTLVVPPNVNNPALMGLGATGGKNIGNYKLLSVVSKDFGFILDGKGESRSGLKSSDNGQTWVESGISNILYFSPASNFLSSFGVPGSNQPQAFTTLHMTLKVTATINKGSELDLTRVNYLDGQATIQMIYL